MGELLFQRKYFRGHRPSPSFVDVEGRLVTVYLGRNGKGALERLRLALFFLCL